MNKNKKWYSLFLVMLISLATVIQPIQAVAAVTALDTVAEETQAKSMETPNVDNINETNKVVEEEPATSVSEETKTTDTIEETISSEVTEETTASEEKTVESSTEETKESKEKPKAKKAVKSSPVNIKEYLEGSEKFLSDVSIKITHDNKEIDYTKDAIPSDALISLNYKFAIPERLLTLEEKPLKAGDYYEITLPEGIKVSNFGGPLGNSLGEEFGTYSVVDGKIRIVFNKNIEVLEDIKGTIKYSERLEETIQAGENTITIPVEGGEKNIDVIVKPNGGSPIDKGVRKADDNKTIYWDVSINKSLETLNNAVVTDKMPEGLTFKKVTIWEQKVNLKGDVISISDIPLVEDVDYKVEGDKVTFLKTTNSSYKLTYESVVDEDKIPEKGGKVTYHNTAMLSNNNENKSANAETSVSYGKLIHKDNPKKDNDQDGHVYKWHVEYNGGEKTLPEGNFITDKLSGDNQKYVQDSLVIKSKTKTYTKDEDYDVEFNKENSEMKIIFKKGLTEKVDIDYKTEVPFVVDGNLPDYTLGNTVTTDKGISESGKGTISREGLIKDATIDYNTKKIEWSIEVNRFKYELNNWSMSDKMTDGLTFDKSTFKIVTKNGQELVSEKDYELVSTNTSFEVKLIDKFATTKETFFVTYTTGYSTYKEDKEDRYNLFRNTATTAWLDEENEKHTDSVTKDVPVDGRHIDNATKSGQYNATSKIITWEVIVNFNQEILKNATISDPIKGDQEYVLNSGKLYEVSIDTNGNPTKGKEVEPEVVSFKDDTVFAKLPNDSSKAYMLVFETSLEGKIISKKPYENIATYENDGRKKDVNSSISPSYGGNFAVKEGKQDEQNRNYVNWNIIVNPSQSTLKKVELIDEPTPNQVIDEKSIVIYGTNVESNEFIGKDEKVVLEKDKDYSVSLTTDNITGQQVLKINFLKEISSAYILEYRTLVNSNKAEDTVSNKFSFTGENEEVVSWKTSSSSKVITSGGSAEGVSTGVKIVKSDANSQTKMPLVGAQFELRNKQGQVLRSGETDIKGELRFGNLRSNYEYVLFETKAPKGFSVSEELRKGKIIKLKKGTELNQFETLELENDIPRIELKKVDADTKKTVKGAEFVIKNADGKFYNGIDEKNKSQWVAFEKEAKKLVSNEKGIVEVVGLESGVYSAKEIKAPLGYDKLTQDVAFEVVDDLGWIRLKNPVTIENKAYETTSVSINKTWDDASNQDGIRPDEITFDLLADGTVVDTLTLSKEDIIADKDIWTKTFGGLRKFDENMKEITYSVKEHEVSGYVIPKEASEVKDKKVAVTNTYKPKLTSISGTKTWVDENNQDGIRPDKVIINLLADGKEIKEVVVNEASKWKYEFKDLPVYKVGEVKQLVKYTVTENKVEGYETTEENNNFTNTHIPATTRVLVEKDWADYNNQDGKRPKEILVQLLADNKEIAGKTLKLEAAKGWKAEFSNLPLKINGKDIAYTIKEIVAEKDKKSGYKPSYDIKKVITKESNTQTDRNEVSHFEAKVTNTKTMEPTTVSGVKTWSDDNNRDGVRPESIEIELLADGQPALDLAGEPVKSLTVKGGNTAKTWSYEFTNIPKHRTVEIGKVAEKAEEIVYTVKEVMSEALKTNNYASKATDTSVTNSREIELTKISGIKTWSDDNNRDGVRPESIEVQLLADGKPALDKDGKEIPVKEVKGGNTAQEWTYEFKDLPKHKAVKADEELVEEANRTIVYTVKEVISKELEDNNYTSKVTDMDVTNSRPIELTEVSGKKIWNDNENRSGARPKSIEVQLLADGQPALDKDGKEIPVKEVNGKNSNDTLTEWTYEFKDLPKHKAVKTGEELVEEADRVIVYTVKEVISEDLAKNGYIAVENGMDVTNTREVIEIPVTKIWKDANNKDGVRPESIKVQLLADGKEVKDLELTGSMKSNEWIDTFKDLPKFANGKEIKYSVKEIEVSKEYEVTYSDDTFTITNTHTPKEVPTSGGKSTNNKSNNNKSGYLPKTGEAETTALVNLGVTMIVIFLMSHIWVSQRRKSKED